MKILILSESPLEKLASDFYAVDPWIRIPKNLANHCEKVTLWQPVKNLNEGESPDSNSWVIHPEKLHIEPHDFYSRFHQYYSMLPRYYFKWLYKAKKLIGDHDLVYVRAPSPMLPLIIKQAHLLKKPVVLGILGDISTQSDRLLQAKGIKKIIFSLLVKGILKQEKEAAKKASRVFVYSKEIEKRLESTKANTKLTQDPLLSLDDFYYREDTCLHHEIRLLRVCWLLPSKGIEYLITAVSLLTQQGFNIKLEIIGQERTCSGYKESLEKLALDLGVADRVQFSGWVTFDKIADIYKRNDIHVLSSLAEGTPRCIIEGFARGVPLVCSDVGGCRDTLVHNQDALMVPPKNPEAIAKEVARIITDSPLRKKLIKRGYELAKKATFETLGQEMIHEFQEIILENKNSLH